jgi:hypothetical protein
VRTGVDDMLDVHTAAPPRGQVRQTVKPVDPDLPYTAPSSHMNTTFGVATRGAFLALAAATP